MTYTTDVKEGEQMDKEGEHGEDEEEEEAVDPKYKEMFIAMFVLFLYLVMLLLQYQGPRT